MLSDAYFENLMKIVDSSSVSSLDEDGASSAASAADSVAGVKDSVIKESEDDYQVTELSDDDSDVEDLTEIEEDEVSEETEEKDNTEEKDDVVSKTDDTVDLKTDDSKDDVTVDLKTDDSKDDEVFVSDSDKTNDTSAETAENQEEAAAAGVNLKEFKSLISNNEELDELIAEYGYDKIFEAFDEDGDGIITDEEVEKLGLSTNIIKDLTTDDIKKLAKDAGLPELDEDEEETELSPELIQKLKEAFGLTDDTTTPAVDSTGSVSGGGGTSGGGSVSGGSSNSGGNNSGSTTSTETPDEMSMEELLETQAEKQTAVDEAGNDVVAVQSGENEAVAAAIEEADELQEAYEKALEEDEEVSEKLKERQQENQKAISEKEEQITEKETAVAEAENTIADCESQISVIDSEISALETSLNNLPAKTDDNKNQHDDIDAMAAQIESKISDAKTRKGELEDEKKAAEEQKEADEKDLKTYKSELEELEAERDEIEKEILENCSDETKEALEAWQEARENIETVKAEELEKAQSALETARSELEEVNTSIKELQEMQIQLENRVGGEGEDVVEFAEKLDGLSASEMKQIMQAAGCQFDDGAWCADFCTYVTKQVYGNDATPGDFANSCSNTAYCPTIASWAESKGALTTDSSQVQPGDFILYYRNGRYSHIGIVTSVNSDGTVNTIEGNTSDDNGNYTNGVVNAHSNRTGTYVLMSQLA